MKEIPSRVLDAEVIGLTCSKPKTKDPLSSVNSLGAVADDLTNAPPSLQDVKSRDGETPPPRGPSRVSLSKATHTVPQPTHLDVSASTKNIDSVQVVSKHQPDLWKVGRRPFQSLGWRCITLPENSVYFHHPTLLVTTNIDLRIPDKLDAVIFYLQNSADESFFPLEGCEGWLVDSNIGKPNVKPTSGWVNHAEKTLTFAPLQSGEVSTAKSSDDDRTFASGFALHD